MRVLSAVLRVSMTLCRLKRIRLLTDLFIDECRGIELLYKPI